MKSLIDFKNLYTEPALKSSLIYHRLSRFVKFSMWLAYLVYFIFFGFSAVFIFCWRSDLFWARLFYFENAFTTTQIKKKTKFSSYIRKFRMELVAKSYMRKGFLIYEDMRKYLTIYEEAVSHIWLSNRSRMNFLICEKNLGAVTKRSITWRKRLIT